MSSDIKITTAHDGSGQGAHSDPEQRKKRLAATQKVMSLETSIRDIYVSREQAVTIKNYATDPKLKKLMVKQLNTPKVEA